MPDTVFMTKITYIALAIIFSIAVSPFRAGAENVEEEFTVSEQDETLVEVINQYAVDGDGFSLFVSLGKSRCIDNINRDRNQPTTLFDDQFTTLYDQMYALPQMFKKDSVCVVIDRYYADNIEDILDQMKDRNENASLQTSSPVVFADLLFSQDHITNWAYTELITNASAYTQMFYDEYLQDEIRNELVMRPPYYSDPDEDIYVAHELYTAVSEIVNRDQAMSDPFEALQEEDITIATSPDGAVRAFSWNSGLSGAFSYEYHTVVQYRVTDDVSRLLPQEVAYYSRTEYEDVLAAHRIDKIHRLSEGIYLLEGRSADGSTSTLFAYDILSGIMRKAFLFEVDGTTQSHIGFQHTTDGEEPAFRLDGDKLFVPEIDSEGEFTGEYSTLYYNFGFFETAEQHAERIATSEKGKHYITRIVFKDGDNLEATEEYIQGSNLSLMINMTHINDDDQQPTGDRFDLKLTCDFVKGNPVIKMVGLPLIDGVGYVENLDVMTLCDNIVKSRKSRLWAWAKPLRVLDVAGITVAVPYQKLRYTAVRFTRKPKKKRYDDVKWILDVNGSVQLLDGEAYSGTQIELTMQPEWVGKRVRVIPFIKRIETDVYAETTVWSEDIAYLVVESEPEAET